MAVSHLCGFETGSDAECYSQAVGTSGTVSVQSTVKRSGTYSLKITTTAGGGTTWVVFARRASGGTFGSIFHSVRFWVRISAAPSSATTLWATGPSGFTTSGAQGQFMAVQADGTLSLFTSGTVAGRGDTTGTINICDDAWHLIEADFGWSSGNGARVWIDGAADGSTTTGPVSAQPEVHIGSGTYATASVAWTLYVDDVMHYDASLGGALGGNPTVSMLLPTSDNAVGNWKRNDNLTTTGLWDAVNNTPPLGTAVTAIIDSRYVQNGTAGSGVAADNLDINCAAYNTISGLSAASQVKAVMPICNDAQQVTTGSPKSGAVAIASNPAVSDQSFDFGLQHSRTGSTTASAQNTFPTAWGTHPGAVVENPSVTVSSGPVVRVKRTGTYTRVLSVDFMGVYVMWTAVQASAPAFGPVYRRVRRNDLLRR